MAERRRSRAGNNVYTVLAAIACLALIFGVVYLWLEISGLTGEANPFQGMGAAPAFDSMVTLGRAALAVV